MKRQIFLYLCIAIITAGCAPKPRYAWNGYDNKLYQHYKNPADHETFIQELKEAVDEATATGNVPPGLYAEYGYALLEKGDRAGAVKYFRLEYDKWPEARFLMTKMIKVAEAGGKKPKETKPLEKPAGQVTSQTNLPELKGEQK